MKERFNGTGGNMNRIEEYMKGLADVMGVKLEYECGVHSFGLQNDKFTPWGKVFDVGGATRRAIVRYANGTDPVKCGGKTRMDNGNGALMRILPVAMLAETDPHGLHRFPGKTGSRSYVINLKVNFQN